MFAWGGRDAHPSLRGVGVPPTQGWPTPAVVYEHGFGEEGVGDSGGRVENGVGDSGDHPVAVGVCVQTERALLTLRFDTLPKCRGQIGLCAGFFQREAVAQPGRQVARRHRWQTAEQPVGRQHEHAGIAHPHAQHERSAGGMGGIETTRRAGGRSATPSTGLSPGSAPIRSRAESSGVRKGRGMLTIGISPRPGMPGAKGPAE